MKSAISVALLSAAISAGTAVPRENYATPKNYDLGYSKCPDESEFGEHLDTPKWQHLSALCKKEVIWQRVNELHVSNRFFVGADLLDLFEYDMNQSFDTVSDTLPPDRHKVVHSRGVITLVEFIPSYDTPYTGIFKGCKHAVMRISEDVQTTPEVPKTAPGHAIKFLRDGMSSGNWLAMFAFDGQPSFNFFKNRWSNVIREMDNDCARESKGKLFATASNHVGASSVMELSEYDQYGKKEEYPNWPFQIDVEPYDVYGWTDKYQNDFNEQLQIIPKDTAVFKVWGYDCPPEHDCEDKLIGYIVSRSKTTTSFWGDFKLFFQHRRYEDDIMVRPHYFEWLQFWDGGKFFESDLRDPAPTQKCPFLFLWEEKGLR